MANLGKGYTFGSTESVTNTKLHNLVDLGTCTGIVNADVNVAAAILETKIATDGTRFVALTGTQTVAGDKTFSGDCDFTGALDLSASTITGGNAIFPAGVIMIWSGAISAIPSGWVICDGTNSTPNLTDRFVIHADADSGGTRDVDDTGGANTHDHTGTTGQWTAGDNSQSGSNTPAAAHTHTISSDDNIPKFYALAYIMKT